MCNKLHEIICEAKCCSAVLGAKFAKATTYGEMTDQLYWDFMRLNAYIRTLERNETKYIHKKEKKQLQSVSIDVLEKKNSFLTLRHKETVVCTITEISPCLSDSEICQIVEHIRLLCATCNCNCN